VAQRPPSPFGRLLRQWRERRGASQLRLALEAGTSARHLSFVETGRSRPSREMVVRLAEALDVPLRERNALLAAAGFAALYRERGLDAPEMEPIRRSLDFLLERHEPFPAYLVDRCWRLVRSNRAGAQCLARFAGPGAVWREQPPNLLKVVLDPDGLRPWVVNWDEVAGWLVARLHREMAFAGDDPELAALAEDVARIPDLPKGAGLADPDRAPDPVLPLHLKRDDLELRLFSTLTTIGTPQDVTLQDLRIESFMPADAATEVRLRELAEEA